MIFPGSGRLVQAGDLSDSRGSTVPVSSVSLAKENSNIWPENICLASSGQTEVSARVEAPDESNDKEPEDKAPEDKEPGGAESNEGEPDGYRPDEGGLGGAGWNGEGEGYDVKTGDVNTIYVPVIMLLLSGILIAVEGIRRNSEQG